MDLPPEILGLALSLLQKRDLKKARQVSKAWEKAVVPHLFDEVFLSTNPADFEIADLTMRTFTPFIKTVTFSSVYYMPVQWIVSKREGKSQVPKSMRGEDSDLFDQHLRIEYANYCRLGDEQQEALESGTCLAQLISALQYLPNLQKLVLADFGCKGVRSEMELRGRGHWNADEVCPLSRCSTSKIGHLRFRVRPQSGSYHKKANPWSLAMLALWATKHPLKELALEPQKWRGLPICHFDMKMQRPYELRNIFQSLKKLRLVLDDVSEPEDPVDLEGSVARALSAAKNLESLCIQLGGGTWNQFNKSVTAFGAILDKNCQFPKLRSLILSEFDSTQEQLLDFFDISNGLEQLTLQGHHLKSGTWKEFATKTRESLLSLKDIELSFSYEGWHHEEFCDCFGRVQDFFFRDGANPFSEQALMALCLGGRPRGS